ncbi:MAG TPA: radical SAM family heme chaperone HemW [Thermoanaerobaculia bacterium]|nr:radical SAM family heme chaperone HemW [Thermoanaerobaculia bacterium]
MTLGIYVHLPFCRVHCTYCAFAISTDLRRETAYVDALLREIEAAAAEPAPPPGGSGTARALADSLYFGGGTPSRTFPGNLARITAAIRRTFEVPPDAEFSMEANPEDVTAESLAAWRDLGVNRLSIGVQSFADQELLPLGRIHGSRRAYEAVSLAVASGLRTNLDLILGLPNQTAESFVDTLDAALALGPGHVSLYMLDLEERSPLAVQLAHGRITLPEEGLVADLYIEAVSRLEGGGLHQYEISNFARPGEECRHNLRYWTRGRYRGFGLGAHSFLGDRRFANTRDIRRYIESSPEATEMSESLGPEEARREVLFLRLRQAGGIDYEEVVRLCGQEGIEWMDRGLRDGWLRRAGGNVAFSPSGFLLSNEYISQLF